MKTLLFIILSGFFASSGAWSKASDLEPCKPGQKLNCRQVPKSNFRAEVNKCVALNPKKTRGWCRSEVLGFNSIGRGTKKTVTVMGDSIEDGAEYVGNQSEKLAENFGDIIDEITVSKDDCHTILRKDYGIQLVGDKAIKRDPKNSNITLVYSADGVYRVVDGKKDTCVFDKAQAEKRLLTRDALLNSVAKSKDFPKKCVSMFTFPTKEPEKEVVKPKNDRDSRGKIIERNGGAASAK